MQPEVVVAEADIQIKVENDQKLDHITKDRAAGPPRRRPPTRPSGNTNQGEDENDGRAEKYDWLLV